MLRKHFGMLIGFGCFVCGDLGLLLGCHGGRLWLIVGFLGPPVGYRSIPPFPVWVTFLTSCASGKLARPTSHASRFWMRLASCCAVNSKAADRQAQSRLMVDNAIVPSRPSRHFFNSTLVSSATGLLSSTLVRCRRGQLAL